MCAGRTLTFEMRQSLHFEMSSHRASETYNSICRGNFEANLKLVELMKASHFPRRS